jgi:hypothetical protein
VSGTIVLNNGSGNNSNDADGAHSAVGSGTSSNTGASLISGITAPGAGYLVGVFLAAGGPSGAAPTALDYTTTSASS